MRWPRKKERPRSVSQNVEMIGDVQVNKDVLKQLGIPMRGKVSIEAVVHRASPEEMRAAGGSEEEIAQREKDFPHGGVEDLGVIAEGSL